MIKNYRLYVYTFISILTVYVAFHLTTFYGFSKPFLENKDYFTGDIARLDYIAGYETYRPKEQNTLNTQHMQAMELTPYLDLNQTLNLDILTLGDSFSHGGGYGINRHYQDYIASDYGLSIANITRYTPFTSHETLRALLKTNFFNIITPKVIILQAGIGGLRENYAVKQLNIPPITLQKYTDYLKSGVYIQKFPHYGFLNSGNFRYWLKQLTRFSGLPLVNTVSFERNLDRSLFTLPHNRILHWGPELSDFLLSDNEALEATSNMDQHFRELANILEAYNISIWVMPIPSKLVLYHPFQIEKEEGKDPKITERLLKASQVHKQYQIVNTRAPLEQALILGEKDLWYADDTHWSYKASKLVSSSMKDIIELSFN